MPRSHTLAALYNGRMARRESWPHSGTAPAALLSLQISMACSCKSYSSSLIHFTSCYLLVGCKQSMGRGFILCFRYELLRMENTKQLQVCLLHIYYTARKDGMRRIKAASNRSATEEESVSQLADRHSFWQISPPNANMFTLQFVSVTHI